MLQSFVQDIPTLYLAETVCINLHMLMHVITDIELWGPLWTHSAFSFESMNGILTSFIHGTQKVPKSAVFAILAMQHNYLKRTKIQFNDFNAKLLQQRLLDKHNKYNILILFY